MLAIGSPDDRADNPRVTDLSRYADFLAFLDEQHAADPDLRAAWVGGSAATGGYDEHSDLDVEVLCRARDVPRRLPAPARVRSASGSRRPDVWELPESTYPDGRQCFVNLRPVARRPGGADPAGRRRGLGDRPTSTGTSTYAGTARPRPLRPRRARRRAPRRRGGPEAGDRRVGRRRSASAATRSASGWSTGPSTAATSRRRCRSTCASRCSRPSTCCGRATATRATTTASATSTPTSTPGTPRAWTRCSPGSSGCASCPPSASPGRTSCSSRAG